MKRFLPLTLGVLVLAGFAAFAQTAAPVSTADFLAQVIQFAQTAGGMTWMGKIAGGVMLLIASMKVTVLNNWIWSKLGSFQIWAAPALGLVAGIVSLGSGLTLPAAIAYAFAGAGAVYLHELLDKVKMIPGLGATYVWIINLIEGIPVIGAKSV